MSLSLQSQEIVVPGSALTTERFDQREITRTASFTTAARALKNSIEQIKPVYCGSENMFREQIQRQLSQPVADFPPFYDTMLLLPVVSGTQFIKPEILAEIHNGLFQVDGNWTCYRRNYLSISCSFTLQPWSSAPLYVKLSDQWTERIIRFSMPICATSCKKPGKVILQPFQPTPLVLGHEASSNSIRHRFSTAYQSAEISLDYEAYPGLAQPSQPPNRHTFERIQFQKATANNGKRRAQQQYYNLVIELYAEISSFVQESESQWIRVARRLSHPLVVRGRSPSHFKGDRRDCPTSMGL
ncbi:hypothetical protein BDQ94DRAFT_175550 [Aspergillus welwitschiae]|uniref:NDT80 domain-containing protein n=1 Tax=Aspergillus welwitschiae TaxID=1341132 RepID=A0A3F3PMG7_9EURO|nr:hypothetical protein BDQ94DRAFT_175550 [Aspergillus welwitschiae]RDH27556.1 hypothetical protein BDQ94DRAFT_175550 [Aspergillus welwitschiae]